MSNLINRVALRNLMVKLAPTAPDPTEQDVEAFAKTFEDL